VRALNLKVLKLVKVVVPRKRKNLTMSTNIRGLGRSSYNGLPQVGKTKITSFVNVATLI
jgi:hypothetical protein